MYLWGATVGGPHRAVGAAEPTPSGLNTGHRRRCWVGFARGGLLAHPGSSPLTRCLPEFRRCGRLDPLVATRSFRRRCVANPKPVSGGFASMILDPLRAQVIRFEVGR